MAVNFRSSRQLGTMVVIGALCLCLSSVMKAQNTVSAGNIQGTVASTRGVAVGGAAVSIISAATGSTFDTTTNDRGTYLSGALLPGRYVVKVSAKNFQPAELRLTVHVGNTTLGNFEMERRNAQEASIGPEIGVNHSQALQDVITSTELEEVPINGRLFLDLVQLVPGVQVQSAGIVDFGKVLFPTVSVGGRMGRTTRVTVDGIDINDEVVGSVGQTVPQSAIQEFQVSRSMLDFSTTSTSSGAINIVTRPGTNDWHGEGFYFFRDKQFDANFPGGVSSPFQRNQFGVRLGGAIVPQKLFVFVDAERTKQDLTAPVSPSGPFQSLVGAYKSPFRDFGGVGRIDWQVQPGNYHFFYRSSYDQEQGTSAFFPNSYQVFNNAGHTPNQAVGLDFTTGSYTHSLRGGYVRYHNQISDGVTGTSIFNPAPQLELSIGSDPYCLTPGANTFCSGPNVESRRNVFQSSSQVRYDGSTLRGAHIYRFGAAFTRTQAGVFAPLAGAAPAVNAPTSACDAFCQALPGGAANPLNYPAISVVLGNGLGASTPNSAFGLHGGGIGPNNQIAVYATDAFKWKYNLTLNYGLRYVRDTAVSDSDLAPIPCSKVRPALGVNCTGNVLNVLAPGLGDRVRQPALNLAPQFGLAWDPSNSGKTVVRFGAGLFYDTALFNNVLLDRAARLQSGAFQAVQPACVNGEAVPVALPGTGTVVTPTFCGQSIGTAAAGVSALQAQYQAAAAALGPGANPVYFGNALAAGPYSTGTALIDPNFKTPRSFQMNIGMQHEMGAGIIFGLNYVRNVSTHDPMIVDQNHVGDSRFLDNPTVAGTFNPTLAAINATVGPAGCGQAASVGQNTQSVVSCYLAHVPGATIADFARNGLDSGDVYCGGLPCAALARHAAFPGVNSGFGATQMVSTIGRSVYNGYEFSLRQDLHRPVRLVGDLNWQFSYILSKYTSTSTDSGLESFAADYGNTKVFIGPTALDRRYQYVFGGTAQLPYSLRLGLMSHFYSPLPVTLTLPTTGKPGGIFVTDVTGDGTGDGSIVSNGGSGDIVPGTNIGAYGRTISASNLNSTIENYNNTFAGKLTPAGQALVTAGVMTQGQLVSLGAVQPTLSLASGLGQVQPTWLKSVDVNLSWMHRFKDRIEVQPGVSVFNVANFANFNSASNPISGILNGVAGSANGIGSQQPAANRIGLGSGVFGLGSPRQIEFSLKISF